MSEYKQLDDTAIVSLTLNNNKEAFGELVTRYTGMLYSVSLGIVGEGNVAEDIVQDTFVDAYLSLNKLKERDKANTSLVSSLVAIGGIKYLNRAKEYHDKGYRYCPSSYNMSYLAKMNGRVLFKESGKCSFGPYRWGSRHEENRIYGVKPFRYLQMLVGCIWDERWADGFSDTSCINDITTKITVSKGGTLKTAGRVFENTLKVTLCCEKEHPDEDYFFSQTHCGKKEFYFARGVGIVRFDFTWGDRLSSSAELVSYTNLSGDDSYMPLHIGCAWEYDEINLTREGYRAKRTIEVCAGMDGKYYAHDMQEFLYLGTEQAYEDFKKSLNK